MDSATTKAFLRFTGERVVPWDKQQRRRPDLMRYHLQRYIFALSYVNNLRVVDLGCGTGYGAFTLSYLASEVIGLDIDEGSVEFARENFGHRAQFAVYDLEDSSLPLPTVERYVAFEVLEHLRRPQKVVERLTDCLLIWSLPVDNRSRFHKVVYSLDEAMDFLPGEKYWQHASTGYIVDADHANFDRPRQVIGVTEL